MAQFVAVVVIVIVGAVLGSYLKPRTVAYLGVGLFAVWVLGALIGAALNSERVTYFFGITAVAIPFIAVLAYFGSVAGSWLRKRKGEQ